LEISVLLAPSLVPPTVNTRSIFPISINSSAYPATAPQAQVSPDTRAERIDSYSFLKSTYNCLNTISQTVPIVNAYDSPTTQPYLKIFDKAFNTHLPPSSKVSYSVGCPTLKPKTTQHFIQLSKQSRPTRLLSNDKQPYSPRRYQNKHNHHSVDGNSRSCQPIPQRSGPQPPADRSNNT
jgi:hypothetical protein